MMIASDIMFLQRMFTSLLVHTHSQPLRAYTMHDTTLYCVGDISLVITTSANLDCKRYS